MNSKQKALLKSRGKIPAHEFAKSHRKQFPDQYRKGGIEYKKPIKYK